MNASIFTQTAMRLSRGRLVYILTLRHFCAMFLPSINTPTHPRVQERNSCSDSPLRNQSRAEVSADNNDPEAHICVSDNLFEVPNSGPQSKFRKRKSQESHGQSQLCKRVRRSSVIASAKNSFLSLRSYFASVLVDERLQFLSWLFEGALPRCISQSDSETPERIARPARYLAQSTDST